MKKPAKGAIGGLQGEKRNRKQSPCLSHFEPSSTKAAWTFEEKLAVATAITMDKRLTPADCRVGLAMLLYFQNTSSGATFPSRPQLCEATGLRRNKIFEATKKLRALGYLTYEASDGGRNKRNSYTFLKTVSKGNRFRDGNGIQLEQPPVSKRNSAPVSKRNSAITPSNLTLRGEASPPTLKRVEASLKEKNLHQEKVVQVREINPATLAKMAPLHLKHLPIDQPRWKEGDPDPEPSPEEERELLAIVNGAEVIPMPKPKPAPIVLEPALLKSRSIFPSAAGKVEPCGYPEMPDFLRRTPEPEATR